MITCPVCEHHKFEQSGTVFKIVATPIDKNIERFGWCPTCGTLMTVEKGILHATVPKNLAWHDTDEGYLEETLKA